MKRYIMSAESWERSLDDVKFAGPKDDPEYEVQYINFSIDTDIEIYNSEANGVYFDFDIQPIADDIYDESTGHWIVDANDLNDEIYFNIVNTLDNSLRPGMYHLTCEVSIEYLLWDTEDDSIEFSLDNGVDVSNINITPVI